MVRLLLLVLAAGVFFPAQVCGEVIRLKSGATIEAPVLVQRSSQVVIDLGVTVLVIPREEILSIESAGGEGARAGGGAGEEAVEVGGGDAGDAEALDTAGTAATEMPEVIAAESLSGQAGGGVTGQSLYRTADLEPMGLQQAYRRVAEAVVMVSRPGGLGSGFFINEQGHLITNYHVIEKETKITVTVFRETPGGLDKVKYRKVRIIAINPFLDLALLKVEDLDGAAVPYVHLGRMDEISVGQSVFAVGNPLGLERSLSEGTVSTVSRAFEGLVYLQTNADINPGNSGGPLFNMAGEVIGVTNMGYVFYGGLGFAIPVNYVKDFIDHHDAFTYDADNPNTGYRYVQPDGRKVREKPDLDAIARESN